MGEGHTVINRMYYAAVQKKKIRFRYIKTVASNKLRQVLSPHVSEPPVGPDKLCGALPDHDAGGVGVAGHQVRHHTRVCHPQSAQPVHSQPAADPNHTDVQDYMYVKVGFSFGSY